MDKIVDGDPLLRRKNSSDRSDRSERKDDQLLGAKYPLRARTCRSFFNDEISIER
jgi:hypothetical protein